MLGAITGVTGIQVPQGQAPDASPWDTLQEVAAQVSCDDYVLQEKLGEGSFGKVFKARHHSTNQNVAIKIIRASRDSTRLRDFVRLSREASDGSERASDADPDGSPRDSPRDSPRSSQRSSPRQSPRQSPRRSDAARPFPRVSAPASEPAPAAASE